MGLCFLFWQCLYLYRALGGFFFLVLSLSVKAFDVCIEASLVRF